MADRDPRRRRESFDTVAALYERYRPGYPDEVVRGVIDAGGLTAESRVLEIGCGTGQLSVPLARLGLTLQAVELGRELAAIAARNLRPYPRASVAVAAFEDWPLPPRPVDAVVCANAWHWLDPDVRFTKAAAALRAGGALVIVHVHHVPRANLQFFRDTNKVYIRWGLSSDPSWLPPTARALRAMYPEIELSEAFTAVRRRRVPWTQDFTTSAYVGMLRTDSLMLGMPASDREGFLEEIAGLIDSRHGGKVAWHFVYEIVSAIRS